MMRLWVALALLLVGLPDVAAADDSAAIATARAHFERGRAEYDAGHFDSALVEFQAAKKQVDLPDLDYNIARCYNRMDRVPEAIGAYQRYLNGSSAAGDVQSVRLRVGVLKARLAELTPAPAPPPKRPLVKRAWFWVTIVGAAAVVGAAVGAGVVLAPRYPGASFGTVNGN